MGQHLGNLKNQNMVRQHVEKRGTRPEDCDNFELIAYGPLFPEAQDWSGHIEPRDTVAALEKALAESLKDAGYDVLNKVRCRKPLNADLWSKVRKSFAAHFRRLDSSPKK